MSASAECLAYILIFDEKEQTASTDKVKTLAEVYKSAAKKVMASNEMKQTLSQGLFAKSGVDFSNEFYAGSIMAGAREDTVASIKRSVDESRPSANEKINELWSFEAHKRYASSNCDLIK